MDWLADMGGFPCTLSRCPIGGRHGADDGVGGLFAAAPQGKYVLVSTLPLAGGTKKMACGALQVVGPREPRGGPGARTALLHGDAIAEFYMSLRAIPGLYRAPPNPQPLGPL